MNDNNESYKPRAEQANILDIAFALIKSVSYKVSLRWVFYGLLQKSVYRGKKEYNDLKRLTARARKAFYKGWTPDTLADDTRQAFTRGDGYADEDEFLSAVGNAECTLDKWQSQDYYVELWYEAKAMHGQFAYYTEHITLRPFGGDPSIPYKWQIAKELEAASERYGLPIVILYFGDLDPKGLMIPESALKDIRAWCDVEFEFIRCGLNSGDELRYNIPENPDKPGTYQWEAVSDSAASEIIRSSISEFVSHGSFQETEDEEAEITRQFRRKWASFVSQQRKTR